MLGTTQGLISHALSLLNIAPYCKRSTFLSARGRRLFSLFFRHGQIVVIILARVLKILIGFKTMYKKNNLVWFLLSYCSFTPAHAAYLEPAQSETEATRVALSSEYLDHLA